MELNWSTFLLEIINFLVLVWILKHFLYKPVLDVIARRRAGIEARLAEAQLLQDEANTLKSEYQNRLGDWEHERQQARAVLTQELNEERAKKMKKLQTSLAQEREKNQIAESRQRTKTTHAAEYKALQQSAEFATRVLSMAAGPELEGRLLDLLLDTLSNLSDEQVAALNSQWGGKTEAITVISAYPLTENQRAGLKKAFVDLSGIAVLVQYKEDSDLLAGLNISIGAWVLQANIRDELKGFTEFAYVAK